MPGIVTLLAGVGFIAGLFIGCIGIGGVIVVPVLVYLGGLEIQTAISSAMMGYLLTGLIGTIVFARKGSIDWQMAGWICAGAMPAAMVGAWLSNNVPGVALETIIGVLTLGSGAHTLLNRTSVAANSRTINANGLVLIGAATGVLSAITGTGGPLVLVPVMLWLQVPVLTAIGLSQAVQLPIAALATVGNFAFGNPSIVLGAMPAAMVGAWLSNTVPGVALETIIGVLTLGSGAHALLNRTSDAANSRTINVNGLVLIGGVTGVLSAITGTGGPLVLVPVMLWLQVPVLTAIGLSQAVQLPIAALATVGNFAFGNPSIVLGAVLGVGLAVGSYAGAQLAHHLPRDALKRIVAIVLMLVGLAIIVKGASRLLGLG